MRFNAERFVTVWQGARNPGEVCKRLRMKYHTATAHASTMRARGVPLKRFKTGPKGQNYTRLARLARASARKGSK